MAKSWNQVGGDVNPKEYGAVLARYEPGGSPWSAGGQKGVSKAQVEVVEIEPDEERGGYIVTTAGYDEDDLKWGEYAAGIASAMGISKGKWQRMSLVDRGADAIRYGGSSWSGDVRHVQKWSDALPAKSNQIAWWSR